MTEIHNACNYTSGVGRGGLWWFGGPASDWSAGIQPASRRVGNKSSVVQDRQFIVDRQGGPSYRSKKLRHDTIAPSWMGVI